MRGFPVTVADERSSPRAWGAALVAFGLHLGAAACFWSWLSRTDWLFGHFRGPSNLLVWTAALALGGIGASVVWFVWSARRNFAVAVVLVVLSLFSALLALGAISELVPRRYGNVQPYGGPKPTDPDKPRIEKEKDGQEPGR